MHEVKLTDSFHFGVLPAEGMAFENAVDMLRTSSIGNNHICAKWFHWKHFLNPNGPSIIVYAQDKRSQRLAAIRALWSWKLMIGGELIIAYQPCESLTDPDYQRMGLLTCLTRMAVGLAAEKGAQLLFNFPNFQSKPVYLKMGWRHLGGLVTLWRPAGLFEIAYSIIRSGMGESQRAFSDKNAATTTKETDLDSSRAFGRYQQMGGIYHGWRSRKLLDWRINNPNGKNRLVQVGNSAAIVNQRQRGRLKEACIIELLWDGHHSDEVKLLMHVIKKKLKPTILTTILTPSHPDMAVYKSLGFRSRSNHTNFVAAGVDGCMPIPAAECWALSGFDIDTF